MSAQDTKSNATKSTSKSLTTNIETKDTDEGEVLESTNLPKLLVKKLHKDAIIPEKGTLGSAGYDLYAVEDCTLRQFERQWISTGIAFTIPKGWYGRIASRSGLAGMGIDACAGVLDSDYTGDVIVLMSLVGKVLYKKVDGIVRTIQPMFDITKGMKIAQVIFTKCTDVEIKVVDELPTTKRGTDGFGSTS